MVTDEHPGYDARAHYVGDPHPFYGPCDGFGPKGECSVCTGVVEPMAYTRRPNLRRVRAWAEYAQATWRIVRWLLVVALAFAAGVYAESEVWK